MPELPEVETVRRGLAPVMEGRRVLSLRANRPDLRFPLPERFAERLTGTRIDALERRGKHLLARLGSGELLVMHLGMSGRFTIDDGDGPGEPGSFAHARSVDPAHDHVVFEFERGGRVTFNDPRRFGYMRLGPAAEILAEAPFKDMGPEPLSDRFAAPVLAAALAGKTTPIKAALLDQRIVAGLGNIYVCEALFRAGIHPARAAGRIGADRLAGLAAAIKRVLAEAIEAGGSSLRDYARADGSLGYFQHAFDVYGRAGEACRRPGCAGVVRRARHAGRSTYYCPACQR